jgi:hypothetical protein
VRNPRGTIARVSSQISPQVSPAVYTPSRTLGGPAFSANPLGSLRRLVKCQPLLASERAQDWKSATRAGRVEGLTTESRPLDHCSTGHEIQQGRGEVVCGRAQTRVAVTFSPRLSQIGKPTESKRDLNT